MMMMDEEMSRLKAAFTAPVPAAWTTGTCPEPDRIWEAVRGELPPEEVREIVDHVAICASCAEDWRIAMTFEKESRSQEREAVIHVFPVRRFQPWIAAAAAALVLSVSGVYYQYQQTHQPGPPAEYRGESSKIASQTAGSLSRESFVLRWAPVAGAESYDLLVTRPDDLSVIADLKGLTVPEHQVPASALTRLPPGSQLAWQVIAVFPDGRHEKSPTFKVLLAQ